MQIPAEILNRKGARKPDEVPADVLELLNGGLIETANLSEWLAIDQLELLKATLQQLEQHDLFAVFEANVLALKKQTATQVIKSIGQTLATGDIKNAKVLVIGFAQHTSDTVRCWAASAIGHDPDSTISQQLEAIRPFAADAHFGVREIAWLAVRDSLIENLEESIELLTPWAEDKDENIRRFASEATRPRGVWCPHIDALKEKPELAYPILAPLYADPSKYVRDSVGNWLNDASKTQPDWVVDVCDRWKSKSDAKETAYIIKKARRTIDKK